MDKQVVNSSVKLINLTNNNIILILPKLKKGLKYVPKSVQNVFTVFLYLIFRTVLKIWRDGVQMQSFGNFNQLPASTFHIMTDLTFPPENIVSKINIPRFTDHSLMP